MALPPPVPRQLSHTRTVVFRGYDREDGLWDIEAELTDTKPYAFEVPNEPAFPAHQPIHGLAIRLTVDDQMLIHAVATSMDHIPHPECSQAPLNMQALVGCRMGRGWRKTIDEKIGGTAGCTHLREMLFNMATAAFQTLPSGQWHRRERQGQPQPAITEAPFHLGHCMTWAYDSPTVARAYPMFYRPRASTTP
jgi:hypothetical protein